jgi:isopenicillin N synthase-like dioxygenase
MGLMEERVPNLSLADFTHGGPAARADFGVALMRGLQRYGFIVLRDHPVSTGLLDEAYRLSVDLFALPEAYKRRFTGGPRGYAPFRSETAKSRSVPDLKEFWSIGPEGSSEPPNIWPLPSPSIDTGSFDAVRFRTVCLELFAALQDTGGIILDALTPGLALPQKFFTPLLSAHNSVLRLAHYPPIPPDAHPEGVRAAAHEDINLLTLLVAAQGAGLELLDRDGRWLPVEADRNCLIIDSGDMLARLTNDVIPATTHRVVNPAGPNVSRYSMPFFMHPNSDVVLSCLPSCVGGGAKYPDITAGRFLEQRLQEIGLLKK